MRTTKIALISITILATLLIGAITINVITAPAELKLKVKWKPVEYTLDNPPPDPWDAEVYFAPIRPLDQVDPSTILLEGIYRPGYLKDPIKYPAPYPSPIKPRLIIPFDGYDVLEALLLKAPHMVPGMQYRINLEITGRLYDGTPFRGSGGINVLIPEPPPP